MTFRLVVTVEAERDILDAAHYFENIFSDLGSAFLADLDICTTRILGNPAGYEVKYRDHKERGVRCCNLRRFPYQVFFRVNEEMMVVVGVRHAGRDPDGRPGLVDGQLDA